MPVTITIVADDADHALRECSTIARALAGARSAPADVSAEEALAAARAVLGPQGLAVRVVPVAAPAGPPALAANPGEDAEDAAAAAPAEGDDAAAAALREKRRKEKAAQRAKARAAKASETPEDAKDDVDTTDQTGDAEDTGDVPATPAEAAAAEEPEAPASTPQADDPAKVKQHAMDLLKQVFVLDNQAAKDEVVRITKAFGVKKLIDVPPERAEELMTAARAAAATFKVAA